MAEDNSEYFEKPDEWEDEYTEQLEEETEYDD